MKKTKTKGVVPLRPYVWVITYITDKYMDRVEKEIKLSGLDIQIFIPKVRILEKEVKNKKQYTYKPLLFNYGFTKMPFRYACSKEKLDEIKKQITAVYGFLKDPSVSKDIPKIIGRDENGRLIKEPRDTIGKYKLESKLAIVTGQEIVRVLKEAQLNSVFDADKASLTVGSVITLSGPVYNGMLGTIKALKEETVKVELDMFGFAKTMIVEIEYGNIFYSVYRDYNPNKLFSGISLDEMETKENRMIDKIYARV